MTTNLTLYTGQVLPKNTDFGEYFISPEAFLADNTAGIAVHDADREIYFCTSVMDDRSILAAIRGAKLVSALPFVSLELLPACFYAMMTDSAGDQIMDARKIRPLVSSKTVAEIKNYVPETINQMLINLSNRNILFEESEILHEISEGRIKKTEELERIINKNVWLKESLDAAEFGHKITRKELIKQLDMELEERRLVKPFLETYLEHCSVRKIKAANYASGNCVGYLLLSKLKHNKNIDFDLNIEFDSEFSGHILDIQEDVRISSVLSLRRFFEKVSLNIYSKEIYETCYGGQKRDVAEKFPALDRWYPANIYLEEGEVAVEVKDYEFTHFIAPIVKSLETKLSIVNKYDNEYFN